jgi:type I restriction enzyme, S subunit
MSEMPEGWVQTTLGEIAEWGSGGTPSRSYSDYYNGTIPWVKTGELGQGIIFETSEKLTEVGLANSTAKIFPKNSVVIAMYGATIGKTAILGIDAATNQACAVGMPYGGFVNIEFLYFYLTSQKEEFIKVGQGGAQPNISQTVIKNWIISLPPLHEQKRIADKLEEVFEFVNSSREKLEQAENAVKQFRQTVLASAISGKLTENWCEENNISRTSWTQMPLQELGYLGRGKSTHRPRNDSRLFGGSYPFIQTGDIAQSNGYITNHSQTYSEFGLSQSKLWDTDTLCITIAANIADTAILTYPACFPDSIVGFVADETICSVKFIKWSIQMIGHILESEASSTAQKNINLATLNEIQFDTPSLPEQLEIVRQIEKLFAFADSLEARIQEAQTFLEQLIPSVLAKAFRGELVPPDPADEPASVLLERIKVAKALELAKPKVRLPRNNIARPKKAGMKKTRLDPDVQNKPYLTDLLKTLGNRAEIKRLYDAANLELPDFYKQLSEEFDRGWLHQTSGQVEVN